MDTRLQSIILEVRLFTQTNCDTGHYLVADKVKKKLTINEWETKFYRKWFGKKTLSDVEVKEEYHVNM